MSKIYLIEFFEWSREFSIRLNFFCEFRKNDSHSNRIPETDTKILIKALFSWFLIKNEEIFSDLNF